MQIAKGVINFPSQNPNTRRFILFHTKDRVSTELTNALRGLNIQSRGRSYAAPSDVPKPEKRGKRVSKDERKHMVEAFVNKYREANAGKFPSANDARNQVGGSYYAVKLILQELVYNSNISPSDDMVKNPLIKDSVKKNESVVEIAEVSTNLVTVNEELESKLPLVSSLEIKNSHSKAKESVEWNESVVEIAEVSTSPMTANEELERKLPLGSSLEIKNNHSEAKESVKRNESVVEIAKVSTSPMTANEELEAKLPLVSSLEIENSHSEAKEELQTNILEENTLAEDAVKSQTTLILETAEDGRKEEVSAKIVQDSVDLKHDRLQNQASSESDNFAAWYALLGRQIRLSCYDMDSDPSTKQIKDEGLHIKPTLWGNLKLLAGDLMNIWKKR